MQIEWLILADAAQIVDQKLYLLGGGWDRLFVNTEFPFVQPIAIAMSFKVPWMETNQTHNIELEVTDQDHTTVLAKLEAGFEVGRPAGLEAGQEQRSQFAIGFPVQIDRPGLYEINARISESQSTRVTFAVVPGPLLAMRMAAGGS